MSVAIRTATRLDVLPAFAGDNQGDVGTAGLVSGRKFATGHAFSVFVPDRNNVCLGKDSMSVFLTASMSVLVDRIAHIVGVSSKPQVSRVHTSRIVASVTDFKVILDRAAGKLKCYAMGQVSFPFSNSMKITVSPAICATSPYPAPVRASRLVNLRPKAAGKVNDFVVVTMKKTHPLSPDPAATFACVRDDFGLLPTAALTVAVGDFLRGVFWGILTHVSSSFQLLAVQRDAYDIAAASCCHNYTTNRQMRQLACL